MGRYRNGRGIGLAAQRLRPIRSIRLPTEIPWFEECFGVALGIDRIGKTAQHILDLLLGITGSPQHAIDLGVRNETPLLHQVDATPADTPAWVRLSRTCAPSRSPKRSPSADGLLPPPMEAEGWRHRVRVTAPPSSRHPGRVSWPRMVCQRPVGTASPRISEHARRSNRVRNRPTGGRRWSAAARRAHHRWIF
jgi:hypothetical protein